MTAASMDDLFYVIASGVSAMRRKEDALKLRATEAERDYESLINESNRESREVRLRDSDNLAHLDYLTLELGILVDDLETAANRKHVPKWLRKRLSEIQKRNYRTDIDAYHARKGIEL